MESNNNFIDDVAHLQQIWDKHLTQDSNWGAKPDSKLSAKQIADHSWKHQDGSLPMMDMMLIADHLDAHFAVLEQKGDPKLAQRAKSMGSSPNPTYPYAVGVDQNLDATPEFTDGPLLRRLSELKMELDTIEKDLHAAEIESDKSDENKLRKQLETLRNKIEEINKKLTPEY